MNKYFFVAGCILCAVAVGTGALGAHGLRDKLDPYYMDVYKTAVLYHFLHALGLVVLSFIPTPVNNKWTKASGIFMLLGIILFSGSLYLLSTKSLWTTATLGWLGPVTPLGGLFFICSWILAATGIFRKKN